MKAFEMVAELIPDGGIEEAKAVAQQLIKGGHKQAAIDLYRCIIGDNRRLTKHLDIGRVVMLATEMRKSHEAGVAWGEALLKNEAVVAFAEGRGPLPSVLPLPPGSRY